MVYLTQPTIPHLIPSNGLLPHELGKKTPNLPPRVSASFRHLLHAVTAGRRMHVHAAGAEASQEEGCEVPW